MAMGIRIFSKTTMLILWITIRFVIFLVPTVDSLLLYKFVRYQLKYLVQERNASIGCGIHIQGYDSQDGYDSYWGDQSTPANDIPSRGPSHVRRDFRDRESTSHSGPGSDAPIGKCFCHFFTTFYCSSYTHCKGLAYRKCRFKMRIPVNRVEANSR